MLNIDTREPEESKDEPRPGWAQEWIRCGLLLMMTFSLIALISRLWVHSEPNSSDWTGPVAAVCLALSLIGLAVSYRGR